MSPPKQRSRYARQDWKKTGGSILIVTEGEKTEPLYIKALCKHLKLRLGHVETVHPPATDPKSLMKHAIDLKKKNIKKAKEKGSNTIRYDKVFVVVDIEKPDLGREQAIREATQTPKAKDIKIVTSNPSFEYWLLLHEEYTTRHFDGCDEVIKVLKAHPDWSNYEKSMKFSENIFAKIPTAIAHSEKCRQHHDDTGGDRNPSTDMDILVRELIDAASPANKIF